MTKRPQERPEEGKPKRVVAIADLHCGHLAGITPPEWWFAKSGGTEERNAWAAVQRETWGHYEEIARQLGKPDVLIVNGDAIDGIAPRSGGTEHVTVDLFEQASMAVRAIEIWDATSTVISYGTSYHVTLDGQDIEKFIAKQVCGEIHSHPFVNVGGCVFDIKHSTTGGGLPHTRANVLGKEWLWNLLWADRGEQPRGHVHLRAHLHFFCFVGDADRIAIIQPPLQAARTKYGARQCRGTVDWGVLEFTVDGGGVVDWRPHLVRIEANRTEPIVV